MQRRRTQQRRKNLFFYLSQQKDSNDKPMNFSVTWVKHVVRFLLLLLKPLSSSVERLLLLMPLSSSSATQAFFFRSSCKSYLLTRVLFPSARATSSNAAVTLSFRWSGFFFFWFLYHSLLFLLIKPLATLATLFWLFAPLLLRLERLLLLLLVPLSSFLLLLKLLSFLLTDRLLLLLLETPYSSAAWSTLFFLSSTCHSLLWQLAPLFVFDFSCHSTFSSWKRLALWRVEGGDVVVVECWIQLKWAGWVKEIKYPYPAKVTKSETVSHEA